MIGQQVRTSHEIQRLKISLRNNTAFSRNIPGFLAAVEKVISHSSLVGQSKNHTQTHKHVCKYTSFPVKFLQYNKQELNNWFRSNTFCTQKKKKYKHPCVRLIPTKYKEVHLSHRLMVPVMLVLYADAQEIQMYRKRTKLLPYLPCGTENTLYQRVYVFCPV